MKRQSLSIRHEAVYHAALWCQAASLPLTPQGLRSLKKAYLIERQKTGCCFASHAQVRVVGRRASWSGYSRSMPVLSCYKRASLIGFFLDPQRENDSHPDIGQRSDGHTVALALLAFAVVVVLRPSLGSRTLPCKLIQGVAQRLDTGEALMDARVIAALKGNRRGASQGLDTACIDIALAIIAPFRQQAGSQSFASAGQGMEDLIVFMLQKKRGDLLIVGRDLLQQRQQLSDQSQHQARLRANGDVISGQLWLVQSLVDLWRNLQSGGMPSLGKRLSQLFDRGCRSTGGGGIGLQKDQSGPLLELSEQFQGHRIIGFQAGRQLIDQAGLHLDQRILVAAQGFEFGDLGTVRLQTSQVSQLRSAMLGQQIGINLVGLGTAGGAFPVDSFRIDRVEGHPRLQQGSDEQTVIGFQNAGDLVKGSDFPQEADQFAESFPAVFHPQRGHFAASFVDHDRVVVAICPIDTGKPHTEILSWQDIPGECVSLYLALEARPSNHHLDPGTRKAKLILPLSVEPGGGNALSPSRQLQQVYQPAEILSKRA